MTSLNLNARAREIADLMTEDAAGFRIAVSTLPSGARVIDAGVKVDGGYNAGLMLSEICMGGLGDVEYTGLANINFKRDVRTGKSHRTSL